MSAIDDLVSLIKIAAEQQLETYRSFVYGHISTYDPDGHRVRVIIPSLRNEDGTPVLSPWMPLGAVWVGNGFGMQVAPFGGATFANPTNGEPCVVELITRNLGVAAVAHLYYNDTNKPPVPTIAPGEAVLFHSTGSYLHFMADGDVDVTSYQDFNVTAGRDINLTAGRNATVSASSGIARFAGQTVQLHASAELRYDTYGYGYVLIYNGSKWYTDSWTTGASAGSTYSINPPEIPE